MKSTGWHPLSEAEWRRLRPYILDCSDLSASTRKRIRDEFKDAALVGVQRLATHLGRFPTQSEVDQLRAALTDHFNKVHIPKIAMERGE